MITLIAVSKATLLRARQQILGCEACSPDAEIPFDWVLDDVAGLRDGSEVDYVLSEAARCPRCSAEVMEKTLVGGLATPPVGCTNPMSAFGSCPELS